MKTTAVTVLALALACANAFAQVPVPNPGGTTTTTTSMNCSSDRLFVGDFNKGVWQFCTGQDGRPMGFLMATAQNTAQLHYENGTLTTYGNDGLMKQLSVTHGQQPYYQGGDTLIQQGGRITAVSGNAVSIVFPWTHRSGQIILWGDGGFSFVNSPQGDPYYILAVHNATGLYGVNQNGELYHHELFFGGISRQGTLVMKGVAAIATPSADSQLLFVGTQAQYDCSTPTPSVNGCKITQAGSVLKVKYDRWSTPSYSTEVVLSGVYPATMWPNNTMAATDTSVYFIEQHPTAGSRLIGYSNKGGTSGVTLMIDKNSGFFQNSQGDNMDPSFSSIALPSAR